MPQASNMNKDFKKSYIKQQLQFKVGPGSNAYYYPDEKHFETTESTSFSFQLIVLC